MIRTLFLALALATFACASDDRPDTRPLTDDEMAEIGARADEEVRDLDTSAEAAADR